MLFTLLPYVLTCYEYLLKLRIRYLLLLVTHAPSKFCLRCGSLHSTAYYASSDISPFSLMTAINTRNIDLVTPAASSHIDNSLVEITIWKAAGDSKVPSLLWIIRTLTRRAVTSLSAAVASRSRRGPPRTVVRQIPLRGLLSPAPLWRALAAIKVVTALQMR